MTFRVFLAVAIAAFVQSSLFAENNSGGSEDQPCILVAAADVDVFQRPDSSAALFGTLSAGERISLAVRTEGGWLGFDPGTAQAGNTGSFRYRWIMPEDNAVIRGDTETLPIVWAPSPDSAYAMTFQSVTVFSGPDCDSHAVFTMPPASAAVIKAVSGEWFRLDLRNGPLQTDVEGWVLREDVSVNGSLDQLSVSGQ